MPSPVVPSDFCSLTPTPATDPCEAIKRVFFEQPALICQLLQYMFDEDGNPNEDFLTDIQTTPPGSVIDFAANTAPPGWLFCDGREVSRTEYAALFAAIGTIWGEGDTTTTFNLPDLRKAVRVGRDPSSTSYPIGATGGSETTDQVPNHSHTMTFPQAEGTSADPLSGRFLYTPSDVVSGSPGVGGGGADVDTFPQVIIATSEALDGTEISIMQPYAVMTPIIKT